MDINALGQQELIIYYGTSVLVTLFLIMVQWKVFEKAGVAGWKCLIPIYNVYLSFKIATGNGWLFLLQLFPVVNLVVYIYYCVKLSKAFDKGIGFALGIMFLNPIFTIILGLGNAKYVGPNR